MSPAPVLHQETRISPSCAPILHISTSAQPSTSRKRPFDDISNLDEEAYTRKHLATDGSVFHRRTGAAPRSFLWRVLDDRRTLELQAVDLVRGGKLDGKSGNSQLTFRVDVEGGIVRNGVAFADSETADALEVFVVSGDGYLHTLTLKRDLLARETLPAEFDVATVWKRYASSALSFRHLYRMVAVSGLELLISLHDGGFIRLQRERHNAGLKWEEQNFSEGGWQGTFRGLISLKRHQTVRYGELELETNAIAAMARSPDGKFIWTVTLDHRLLAWSTASSGKGRPVLVMDLLGEDVDEGRKQKYVMGAEQGTVMQLIAAPSATGEKSGTGMEVDSLKNKYHLVVHSSRDHQFKFYEVNSHWNSMEGDMPEVRDLQPRTTLIPPVDELLESNIWHLENFFVLNNESWEDCQIWVRARSGSLCRVFTMNCALLNEHGRAANVADAWKKGWSVVDEGMQTAEALKMAEDYPGDLESVANTAVTPTERWLKFLFHPERFSTASIEAALYIYRKGRGLPSTTSGKGLNAAQPPLQERLAQAVSAKILLKRSADEQPDYDQYQSDIHAQWKTFYTLLSHLHNKRHDSIGFSVDAEQALPWTVSADFVSPIRASSGFEKLVLNEHLIQDDKLDSIDQEITGAIISDDESIHTATLLSAAHDFRTGLSASFRSKFQDAAIDEAVNHPFVSWEDSKSRVLALYDSQDFTTEVMDDDFAALEQAAEGFEGLGNLSANAFLAVFEKMDADSRAKGRELQHHLRRFGERFMVAVAQETLQRDRTVLLDMLALIVFMYGDLDQSDLHEEFVGQIAELYDSVITRLRQNEFLTWLASNQMAVSDRSTTTLLEALFLLNWKCIAKPGDSMTRLLTKWSKSWVHGLDLNADWDGLTGHVLAALLKNERYDLATNLLQFISQGEESPSWLRYLEGTLELALGEYELASTKFVAAAEGLSDSRTKINTLDPTSFIPDEAKNYFGAGPSRYYQHVAALFDKVKVHAYVADFAQLALDNLETNEMDMRRSLADIDRRKSHTDSPASKRIDDTMEEIRILKLTSDADDLRNRLFNALVQTARWPAAFDALALMKNSPPKNAGLKQLIESAVKSSATDTILGLPFAAHGLRQSADAILAELARKSLATGAGGIPYHRILYAFRVGGGDFRGAAEILYAYLVHLRAQMRVRGKRGTVLRDPEDDTVVRVFVLLIDALVCCGEGEGWLLADEEEEGEGGKRRLVRLEDVRREYVAELDRRSEVVMGRFPVVGAGMEEFEGQEGMEVDVF